MINTNYTDIIAQARRKGATHVDFDNTDYKVKAITPGKDTLTLSDAALAKMNGEQIKEIPLTYVKPVRANSLLANNEPTKNTLPQKSASDIRFDDMMQNILDKRLGVDREKLKEIEAMMEEVAKNENLSPEQKQKAMEELEKIKEKVIEESLEIKKQAKKTFTQDETS
jgi:hypothetical protein